MLYCLLSPAKKLTASPKKMEQCTEPLFSEKTQQLADLLKQLSPEDISILMGVSRNLSELNYQRFQSYSKEHRHHPDAGAAVYQFEGDVYRSLDIHSLSDEQCAFASKHVGILSGFYGLLRPFDWMQPYRLEMGTSLNTPEGIGLYRFWGDSITEMIQRICPREATVINLASSEYAKSVQWNKLDSYWTIVFKEQRESGLKIVGVNAKRARGAMTRWIIQEKAQTIEVLMKAKPMGYCFHSVDEKKRELLFVRVS